MRRRPYRRDQIRWGNAPVVWCLERVIVAKAFHGGEAGDGGALAVTLAVHLDDGGVVNETVRGRDRHGGVRKNVWPS